jgi:hypothetical protein
MSDDLSSLRDDMTAFIEGHGMRRFSGFVHTDEIPSVMWQGGDNPDAWKDFVELAKAAGASFLTMNAFQLDREELDWIIEALGKSFYAESEEIDDARWLKTYSGKTGFVQLAWPHQGVMFVYETSAEWYERYQRLAEMAEEFGGISFDEAGEEEDDEKGSF